MVTDDILVKYIVGEAEPHETAMIEQWRKASVDNEKHLQQFETLWEKSNAVKDQKSVNVDLAWQHVQEKIHAVHSKDRVFPIARKWLVAASITLIAGIGLFLFNYNKPLPETMLTATVTNIPQNLQLEDGSKVNIQSGTLSYPKEFKGDKRQVVLNGGKAFFAIAHNKEKPFEIQTENTSITVLGTEFEVISDKDQTEVRVKEGRVRFNTPKGEMVLTAGMGAKYSRKTNLLEKIMPESRNTFSYISGKLDFKNETLKQVVKDLNQYYKDVSIELDNKALGNCRITSSFDHDQLETVLNVITLTLNLQAEHLPGSNTIIIKGEGCY